jgi:oligopeptide transport system substrate-binding protein
MKILGIFSSAILLCLSHGLAFAQENNAVIRTIFPVPETGFDPSATNDLYSSSINQAIFDTLYTYDYLARPVVLVPRAAAAMPTISEEGKTYTIPIKKGIYFYPDPVFAGKKRELIAEDFVYSFKRMLDPRLRSPNSYFIEGLIQGLDDYVASLGTTKKFDYTVPIEGIKALDRYTLQIKLNDRSYTFAYILAHTPFGAVAQEVIEKYADPSTGRAMNNPVGTGPYYLKEWTRVAKIVLEKNPYYRDDPWHSISSDPNDASIIQALSGKKMPLVPKVEVLIMEENQSQILAYAQEQLDILPITSGDMAPRFLDGDQLKPSFAKIGYLSRVVDPEISYYQFLMTDPAFGGLAPEKIAFRRAVLMSMDTEIQIRVLAKNQAKIADYPIPEGVVGHLPDYQSILQFDVATANKLLDDFGYRIGADGYRTFPDGKPLILTYTTRNDSAGRQGAEYINRSLANIHVNMKSNHITFAEMIKGFKQCSIQFFGAAWIADYPDGENFMQLLYGPNTGKSNNGCGKFSDIDALYEKSTKLSPGEERDQLYLKMARLAEIYGIWQVSYSRYRNVLARHQVIGYKKHPILNQEWQYIDIKQ